MAYPVGSVRLGVTPRLGVATEPFAGHSLEHAEFITLTWSVCLLSRTAAESRRSGPPLRVHAPPWHIATSASAAAEPTERSHAENICGPNNFLPKSSPFGAQSFTAASIAFDGLRACCSEMLSGTLSFASRRSGSTWETRTGTCPRCCTDASLSLCNPTRRALSTSCYRGQTCPPTSPVITKCQTSSNKCWGASRMRANCRDAPGHWPTLAGATLESTGQPAVSSGRAAHGACNDRYTRDSR